MRLSLPWRRGRHGSDGAATTPAHARPAVKRAACAVLAAAAAVPLAVGVHSDLHLTDRFTSPAWNSEFTQLYRREECLYLAIRSAVPKGAPVYVNNSYPAHTQQLAELSTLWAVPQEHVGAADWALTISHETLAGYRHHKRRRFMTYRYCPAGTLLSVKNLVATRQARPGAGPAGGRHRRQRQQGRST
jgi:hypothetical protein